jgi:hypothetical protein
MPFNNWPCPQRQYLSAVEELEKILDEDKYSEGGYEKDKTGRVVIS